MADSSPWAISRVSVRDPELAIKVMFTRTSTDQGVVSGSDGSAYLMHGLFGSDLKRRQVFLVDSAPRGVSHSGGVAYLAKWQVVNEGDFRRYSVFAKLAATAPMLSALADSKGWIKVGSLDFSPYSAEAQLKLAQGLAMSLIDTAQDRAAIVGGVALRSVDSEFDASDPISADSRGMYSLSCNTFAGELAGRSNAVTCRQIPVEFDLCASAPLSAGCRVGKTQESSMMRADSVDTRKAIEVSGFDPVARAEGSASLTGEHSGKIVFPSELSVSENGALVDCEKRLVVKASGIDGRVNPVCKFQLAPVMSDVTEGRLACAVHVHFQGAVTASDKICIVSAHYLGDTTEFKSLQVIQP